MISICRKEKVLNAPLKEVFEISSVFEKFEEFIPHYRTRLLTSFDDKKIVELSVQIGESLRKMILCIKTDESKHQVRAQLIEGLFSFSKNQTPRELFFMQSSEWNFFALTPNTTLLKATYYFSLNQPFYKKALAQIIVIPKEIKTGVDNTFGHIEKQLKIMKEKQ